MPRTIQRMTAAVTLTGGLWLSLQGCQSLPEPVPVTATSSVPPLSTAAGTGLLAPGVPRPDAHIRTAQLVPPAPDQIQQTAWMPPAAPPAMAPPAPAPEYPAPTPVLPVATKQQQPAADPCLPDWQTFREEFQQQTAQLTQRLSELERELQQTRGQLSTVNGQLQAAQEEITRLNTEVSRGRQQVRTLETRMQVQQQADLDALNELHTTLNKLLRHPQAAQPGVTK